MCTGYLVLLVVVFGGFLQSAGKPAPDTAVQLPERARHQQPHGPDGPRRPAPSGTPGPTAPGGQRITPSAVPADATVPAP
ncbi:MULTISPECIES: hypothetical protein [unclassified Streptomyces]|uniref:hypothetical protein n=1 Tax=unclassified Streptomyces TaxID=2593676 RepID=UPI0004761278|nr:MULTISPECIES: hypothetical protein [unclassified Streptomyces]MYT28577.1 hypothetical protein [Streptomyces sp. SID8354]